MLSDTMWERLAWGGLLTELDEIEDGRGVSRYTEENTER